MQFFNILEVIEFGFQNKAANMYYNSSFITQIFLDMVATLCQSVHLHLQYKYICAAKGNKRGNVCNLAKYTEVLVNS